MEGRVLDERFELERFVARGGYGSVYRGRHRTLGCPIAVKVLETPESLQGQAREQAFDAFRREASTVATLRHHAIVRVFDAGITAIDDTPRPFIAMEWVDGETLDQALRRERGRTRSPRAALALLRPVIEAIACAHEAGVVHRDLKPGNVMLTVGARGEPSARVLDFGVAKVMSPDAPGADLIDHTSEAFSPFSLSHASPEQIGRLRTGPWTDVHALALLLVECLTGERALRGGNSVELFASITAKARPTPAAFGCDVGPWEPVLAAALSLVPADRPRDAATFLAALDADVGAAQKAWENPAVITAPAPPIERPSLPRSPERPRRALPVAVVAALVGAVLGSGYLGRTPATSRTAPPLIATAPAASAPFVSRGAAPVSTALPPSVGAHVDPAIAASVPADIAGRSVAVPEDPHHGLRGRAQRAERPERRETAPVPVPTPRAQVDGIAID